MNIANNKGKALDHLRDMHFAVSQSGCNMATVSTIGDLAKAPIRMLSPHNIMRLEYLDLITTILGRDDESIRD
jgi:hypothetical protein